MKDFVRDKKNMVEKKYLSNTSKHLTVSNYEDLDDDEANRRPLSVYDKEMWITRNDL